MTTKTKIRTSTLITTLLGAVAALAFSVAIFNYDETGTPSLDILDTCLKKCLETNESCLQNSSSSACRPAQSICQFECRVLHASSTAECRPEYCPTIDWRVRARLLPIPEYTRSIDDRGRLVLQSQRFSVIMPDDAPNAEAFGRIHLYRLRLQYENTERLLGQRPYLSPDTIIEEYLLNHSSTGSCCGSEEEGYPLRWNLGTREEYLRKISLEDENYRYLRTSDWSQVAGNHELTHRFVLGLRLDQFIDEGLAMYAQDRGWAQDTVCQTGGYQEGHRFTPYRFLCLDMRTYHTGDCLWRRVETRYGLEMVRRVISRLYDMREREAVMTLERPTGSPIATWNSFTGRTFVDLRQAFVSEIGERFWEDFRDFGFSPTMATGLTYASERERTRCD